MSVCKPAACSLAESNGNPVGIIGSSRDITGKKRAEEAWEEAFAQIEANI